MPPLDRALFTTDELLEELALRHHAVVAVLLDHDSNIQTMLHGTSVECSGLLASAQNEILWASFQLRQS